MLQKINLTNNNDFITGRKGAKRVTIYVEGKGRYLVNACPSTVKKFENDAEFRAKHMSGLERKGTKIGSHYDFSNRNRVVAGAQASAIREWAIENNYNVGKRGRLSEKVISDYHKHKKN